VEPGPGQEKPHLPPPSLWPVGFAIGVVCILVGLIISWPAVAVGAAITVIFAFLWVRDVTSEYRRVPVPAASEAAPPTTEAPALPAHEGEAAMPEPEPGERFPRSKFLEGATLGLGGVIGGLVTVPVVGLAVAPAFVGQSTGDIDLGSLSNFPENQWMLTTFFLDPSEGEVTRRTAYIRNNGQLNGQPSFTIISNRCAHLGCPVQPNGPVDDSKKKEVNGKSGQRITLIPMIPAGGFGCPCHGGQYDPEGNRTAGPPVRALDRYGYKIENGRLVLGKTFSVGHVSGEGKNARISKYKLHGPGEHLKGIEGWFYPIDPPH
jgi:Rieske Fe-S protein